MRVNVWTKCEFLTWRRDKNYTGVGELWQILLVAATASALLISWPGENL